MLCHHSSCIHCLLPCEPSYFKYKFNLIISNEFHGGSGFRLNNYIMSFILSGLVRLKKASCPAFNLCRNMLQFGSNIHKNYAVNIVKRKCNMRMLQKTQECCVCEPKNHIFQFAAIRMCFCLFSMKIYILYILLYDMCKNAIFIH